MKDNTWVYLRIESNDFETYAINLHRYKYVSMRLCVWVYRVYWRKTDEGDDVKRNMDNYIQLREKVSMCLFEKIIGYLSS